ncbi:MAG TPA: SGNH/GDSL hydrolase family protein [Woeseiaceae bacterium]|nr:SGNH/GDSL hydrolase family protein [Woeseiaceae bacterium]
MRIFVPYTDLFVVTGRIAGRNQMEEWAQVDAFSAYRAKPGQYGSGSKTVNRHGFISTPDIETKKPPGTVRIVFLGGSSTAGSGHDLADELTWPWLTSQLLRERTDRDIDFINGALPGYTTFESYGRLWSRLRFFQPDIIVVYHGWNDMYYMAGTRDITAWKTLPDGSWGFETGPKIAIYAPHWSDHVLRYSQLLTKFRIDLTARQLGEIGLDPENDGKLNIERLEVFRTNLKLIREAATVMNAELFVAKQATLIVADDPIICIYSCRYEYHGFGHEDHVEAYNRIYAIIDEEIDASHVIDATEISGSFEMFVDHVHPTESGAKKIADIVADAIQPNL